MDGDGSVALTGYFFGSVDSGGTLNSAGGQDIFLVKLDPDGNHV